MNIINWNNHTPDTFTEFCNALLVFEVSKSVKVFSAPGKDGGVDASYTGQYGENSGDWRFQYKFHRVSRKQGYYSLKSELSSEIQKIKNEDNFVFITNVELLPQEQLELEKLFESEKGDISPKTKFFIWDGAKLQTLLIGHPLLIYWLEEGFETAQLQSFETYFRKGIETNNFAPNTLSNIFIGRKKVFADLEKCLDLKKNIILIQGEAGIGKTRLLIEFFKTLKTKNSMWRVLVLANKNVDFDKIKRALSDHHKYILMVDDAHSYDGKDISDLLKISEATNGRVKLFLTARSIQASTSLQHIREYDQDEILTINLSTLERAETQAALEPYLKQTSYFHHIGELIQITYGRPILIVAVLRAIQDRTRIETIRETNFLKTYVNNYFNEFHNEFQKLTGTSNLRSKRLLQNIALIEPFNFDDSNIINKLVEIHELHHTEITTALKLLKNYSFVSGRYEQSIKPDYYSDIVLQDISVQEASNHIMDFGAQLDNIVVNLSSVDEIGDDKSALLDDILKTYVGWIDKIEDNEGISNERKISTISRILHTVARIVYVKPKIARKAIEFYLKNFLIPGHPVNLEMASNGNFNYVPTDALIHKVATILSRLFLIPEYFGFVYDTSLMLFEMSNEKTIVPIFNFGKRDLIENYGLTRQRYVLNRISKEIENINPLNFRFVKQIFKAMLNLEFTVTENSAVTRDALAITTYRLPNSESVKNLRENIIAILEISYERPQLSSEKLETLKLILDVPRGILSTHRNNRPYQNDNEIFRVLDFIERKGEYFTLLEQKETLDKLFWFTKWGIDEKFKDKIEEVKGKLKPKDLAEKLSQLFGSDQVAILRNSNIHSYVAEQCESIAREVPEQELALAMKKFLEPQPYQPHYFWEFLRHLEKNHISHAIRFHDLLMESASPLYYQYASSLLSTLRFSQDNTEMFWERVEKLQNLDYWEADNVILLAYGNKVPGTSFIEDRDVDVILKINDKNRHENDYALASGLQSIITANYPDVNNILGDYLDRVGQRDAEMFFIWLLDNKMANNELVRYLVVEKTIRFYLSYEIERGLAFVLKYFGPLEVFKYLVRRFEHKKMEVIATRSLMGYEFLPHGENTQLFDEAPELKLEMFKFALDWFLSTESAGGHLFYGKDMLVYLQPDQSITDDTYVLYIEKIEQLADSLENLEKIADTLSIFHNKNSLLFTLIARIYASGISLRKENQEMFNHLYFSLHSALTTVGVKSGQAGIPFQVDLDLKELILKEMDQLSEFDETRHLLKEVLANIENEINRNFDHDNETW